jgi:YidC/Oxa1 family membrane protein insertase
MNPRVMRIVIPLVVAIVALGVVVTMFTAKPKPGSTSASSKPAPTASPALSSSSANASSPASQPNSTTPAASTTVPSTQAIAGLRAAPLQNTASVAPQPLGSIDPREADLKIDFARTGAGVQSIVFSNQWQTAAARRKAEAYIKSLPQGAAFDPTKIDETQRYVLQTAQPLRLGGSQWQVPIFAAHSIVVNGTTVPLFLDSIWSETDAGQTEARQFETRIIDANGKDVLLITRRYVLGKNYEVELQQRIRNVSDQPLSVQWKQYGPTELNPEGYIDRRRVMFGYLPDAVHYPTLVLSNNNDLFLERTDATKRISKAADPNISPAQRDSYLTVWPTKASQKGNFELSWFAATNRYFGLAIHPSFDSNNSTPLKIQTQVQEIRLTSSDPPSAADPIFTFLYSPQQSIAPGAEALLDLGIYAGPLDRHVLDSQPYSAIDLGGLILYQMSSTCAFCTFQWLAQALLWFLSFLHNFVVFDWGLAIIGLVMVVRSLLHPLTKKSQVNMQRFGKQMGAMKPEIDKLQKRYPDDPKKVQAEQMRLMREHGINPLQMLGCLPMFLQMPIWIALYAMLYFAFDIRQQPGFYGIFQHLGNWSFMGDLSSADAFMKLPGGGFTLPILNAHIASINLLPLLMGFVFFFQQKYMSPPPSATMTPEQEQQQKIMKVLMVGMMPVFLYQAPCGLTLYILTSSCIGILESKYIRKHVSEMDLNPPTRDKVKPKGARAKLFADAIERAREKSRLRNEPPKNFKKRK